VAFEIEGEEHEACVAIGCYCLWGADWAAVGDAGDELWGFVLGWSGGEEGRGI